MFFLFLAIFSAFFAAFLWFSLAKGAPWLPTPKRHIRALLDAVSLKPNEVVIDAGCGDGRVLLLAAREYGARGIGIEIHPLWVWIARLRVRLAGLGEKITIQRADIFRSDLTEADVLFLFLLQQTNVALQKKLAHELRPGTRIVSFAFTLPEFEELYVKKTNPTLHVYRVR